MEGVYDVHLDICKNMEHKQAHSMYTEAIYAFKCIFLFPLLLGILTLLQTP